MDVEALIKLGEVTVPLEDRLEKLLLSSQSPSAVEMEPGTETESGAVRIEINIQEESQTESPTTGISVTEAKSGGSGEKARKNEIKSRRQLDPDQLNSVNNNASDESDESDSDGDGEFECSQCPDDNAQSFRDKESLTDHLQHYHGWYDSP